MDYSVNDSTILKKLKILERCLKNLSANGHDEVVRHLIKLVRSKRKIVSSFLNTRVRHWDAEIIVCL